jgi:hypothetical protein
MHISIILFFVISLAIVIISLFVLEKIKNNELYEKMAGLSLKIENDSKTIFELQKMLAEESKQKVLYRDRSLELEDAIKEGVGVTLRNEVTRVECIFDSKELTAMLEGTKHLIKEYWQSTAGVKFYLTIIEKIEKNVILMHKSEDEKKQ